MKHWLGFLLIVSICSMGIAAALDAPQFLTFFIACNLILWIAFIARGVYRRVNRISGRTGTYNVQRRA